MGWAALVLIGLGPAGIAFLTWDLGMKKGHIQFFEVAAYAVPPLSTALLIMVAEVSPLRPSAWPSWLPQDRQLHPERTCGLSFVNKPARKSAHEVSGTIVDRMPEGMEGNSSKVRILARHTSIGVNRNKARSRLDNGRWQVTCPIGGVAYDRTDLHRSK